MIDPGTNEVLATVDLPVDVVTPVVLDDAVIFAGYGGPTAVVVDRGTWKVSSTVELPRATGGAAVVSDGERIYVPTMDEEPSDVLVLDAQTYDVVDTIHPLAVNSMALRDGSLWVSHAKGNVLQRFDLPA